MQALLFDPAPRRLLWAGAASRIRPTLALGRGAPLRLAELPTPQPPTPEWAQLQVLACGVCGSDVKQVLLQASSDNPLSGLVSFPHVPGHEIVARVLEPGASGLAPGSAVVVDPWLGCVARGVDPPCPSCRSGFPPHCRRVAEGGPWGGGAGLHLGNVRGLPGGFGELLCAHPSQLHPLPEGLPTRLAVLADPVAVALHAVERARQAGGGGRGPALILGAGTIGLSLTLAAREAWPERELWVTTAWEHQRQPVQALGAEPWPAQAARVVPEAGRRLGARLVKPWRGGAWLLGSGVELVLDSIGDRRTTELGLRCLAPGGRMVSVGVGRPQRTETTLGYYKEAEMLGSNGYGRSTLREGAPHLLDQALELLAARSEVLQRWLTHSFPLTQYREALAAAAAPQRSRAIKVTLLPGGHRP